MKEKYHCCICGRENSRKRISKDYYCEKHYSEYMKYGFCISDNDRSPDDPNEIIEHDKYAEIILYDEFQEDTGKRALIDIEDVDKVKDYKWRYSGRYILTTVNSKSLRLHRLIMNCDDEDKVVDHINLNVLDNRKSNLRICTKHENDMNHKVNSANKSGITGVCFSNRKNKWRAYIYFDKRNIELGYFDKKDDAIKCRLKAEKYYFGEFSSQNRNK